MQVERIGNSSMAMRIELHGTAQGEGADDLRAVIALVQVHVDLDSGEALRIPDSLRQAFAPFLDESAKETVDA